ncbi:MAG: argininosuccinate synthase [Armatimonadetes bacterium]|nr:argininosuccinate synthase [Armatimonadota bacterium]
MAKCVLAYSGGLDTSVCIKWLKDKKGVDVVAVSIDVGEERDYEGIRQKAEQVGAVKALVVDAKEEFFESFISRAIKANLLYEGRYPAFTSLARPLLARKQVEVARAEGAEYLAHGCTGQGNDQVRFEVTYSVFAPEMKVIAPVREWEFGADRAAEMDYAREHGIPVPVTKASPYSTDTNLWGHSIECGPVEIASQKPPEDAWSWTVNPAEAPDEPETIAIEFEAGVPVGLDGDRMSGVELVQDLNARGGRHGIGRVDMMENRLVGIKSRELYETPAATIILAAHRDLEAMTLDRETAHFKPYLEQKYAELVYYGLWYTPLRKAIDAFIDQTQETVTGTVTMELYKGSAAPVARESPCSLYDLKLATYEAGGRFDQAASAGFIKIFGLPAAVAARVRPPS